MSDKITMALTGVPELIRSIKLMDEETREGVFDVLVEGGTAVLADAKARIHSVSGELAATGRLELRKDQLAVYVDFGYGTLTRRSRATVRKTPLKRHRDKIRAQRAALAAATSSAAALDAANPGIYAAVVEHGDPKRHHAPHAYMIPALADEKPTIVTALDHALSNAAKKAESV